LKLAFYFQICYNNKMLGGELAVPCTCNPL